MHNKSMIIVGGLLLLILSVSLYFKRNSLLSWWNGVPVVVTFNEDVKKNLAKRIDYMCSIVKSKGLEAAIKKINDESEHVYYLFLFEDSLPYRCLAHGGNKEFVGKTPDQIQEVVFPKKQGTAECNVVQLVNKFAELAHQSGGLHAYKWRLQPQEQSHLKVSYIKPLTYNNKHYFIGSGLYTYKISDTMLLQSSLPVFDDGMKNFLITRVDHIAEFVNEKGLDEVLAFINNSSDNFAYTFLFDASLPYKCLAHGGNKDFINQTPAQMQQVVYPTSQKDVACDVVKLIDSFASLARKGGGFQVYNWRVRPQDASQLKISYIKPLTYKGKQYFIGSGVYTQNIPDYIIIPNRVDNIIKKIERDGLEPVLPIINNETDLESYVFLAEAHPPYLMVAHGGNNNLIGKTAQEMQEIIFPGATSDDYSMVKLLSNLDRVARIGSGFHAYLWRVNPSKPEQLKISYSRLLVYKGKEYFIGTGYSSKAVPDFVKDTLPKRVNELLKIIKRDGMKKVLPIIAQSSDRESYFFIDEAKPPYSAVANANKKLIGMTARNQSSYLFPNCKDEYADVEKLLQSLADVAKRGGGFCVYIWRLSAKEPLNLKVAYVKPIDDNYLLGAGYYV